VREIIGRLLARGPVVTDGAWGTQLQARGLALGEFPDAWNLTRPEQVLEVAKAYVEAGSQIILTNTFGANRLRLAAHHLEHRVIEINRAGVEISRTASAGRALVFASIGPTGKLLMDEGVTPDEIRNAFEEQAHALANAGADGLVVETMSDLAEARLAVAAASATGLPVVGCMVFDSGSNKDRTMMGDTPERAADVLTTAGADFVGANCGQGISGFAAICQRLHAATDAPVWIKPNAGLPHVLERRVIYDTTAAEFAAFVPPLVQKGARFIGGCCGTSPEFVRAIRQSLASIEKAGGEPG
jgi:methionine synthase I (cobalamin-dependent)